jgi:hypothetical protein
VASLTRTAKITKLEPGSAPADFCGLFKAEASERTRDEVSKQQPDDRILEDSAIACVGVFRPSMQAVAEQHNRTSPSRRRTAKTISTTMHAWSSHNSTSMSQVGSPPSLSSRRHGSTDHTLVTVVPQTSSSSTTVNSRRSFKSTTGLWWSLVWC